MYIIALMPALGTLATIVLIAWNIIKKFADLKAEVKDDLAVKKIKNDTEKMAGLYKSLIDAFGSTKTQIEAVYSELQEAKELYMKLKTQTAEIDRRLACFSAIENAANKLQARSEEIAGLLEDLKNDKDV